MAPIVSAIVSCRAAIGAVRRRLLVIALAVTAAWAMPSTRAEAQGQSAAALKAQVSRILRQPQAPSAEEQKMLEDYFAKSFFPSMTDESPEQLGQLAEKRKDLFVQYINVRGSQAARDQLLAITMKSVGQGIAIRNYHPAIRFNAVLILGQLDKESARSGSGAPVPYPAATNALIALLERDEFGGVPVPSSVKVAALIGLDRHTRLGADSQFTDRITSTALAVAQQQEKPDDLSPAAHDWMRRLAARVLMNQYAKGLTPAVNQALAQLVGSKSVSLDDRCSVAETLQKAMFEGAQGVDAGVMAQAIGRLASDVLSYEAKQARKYQRELLEGDGAASSFGGGLARGPMGGEGFGGRGLEGGGRGFGGFPGEGFGGGIGGFGAEVDEGPRIEKRRLLDRLKAVADGAEAIAAGSSDETKERMSALAAPVRRVFNDSSGNNATDVSIAKAVVGLSQEVEALVADWAPPAEEEPAEEDAAAAIDEAAEAPAETEPAAADAEAPAAEEAPAN